MEIDAEHVHQAQAHLIHIHVIRQQPQLKHAQMLEVWAGIDVVHVANLILVMVQLNMVHRVQMEPWQMDKYVIAQ